MTHPNHLLILLLHQYIYVYVYDLNHLKIVVQKHSRLVHWNQNIILIKINKNQLIIISEQK